MQKWFFYWKIIRATSNPRKILYNKRHAVSILVENRETDHLLYAKHF